MVDTKTLPVAKKDITKKNVVTLGVGMSLVLMGIKVSSSFIVPVLGTLGSICMALLWFSNSFSNFIVPPILNLFKNERSAMAWMSLEYGVYVLAYSYVVPAVNAVWSLIHGIFAAVLWTAEGIYLTANSNDKDRGYKSGMFWTIYMSGTIIGNFAVFLILNFIGIEKYDSPKGWHGSASIMFIFLGITSLLGSIPMFLLKPSPNESTRKFVSKSSTTVLMKKVLKMTFSQKMIWLLLPMAYLGFQYVFVGAMLTRQVNNTSYVGLMMSVFSLVETTISTPLGMLLDKKGTYFLMMVATCIELVALAVVYRCNIKQDGVFYIAFALLSISDSSYQTLIPAIIGNDFIDQESANSVFRLLQNLGGCICYLIAPLFVASGEKKATLTMFTYEVCLCAGLGILCLVSFIFYNRHVKNPVLVKEVKKPTTEKVSVEVSNEDMEAINRGDIQLHEIHPAADGNSIGKVDVKEVYKTNEDAVH